jgi:hypothetical protein
MNGYGTFQGGTLVTEVEQLVLGAGLLSQGRFVPLLNAFELPR